LLDVKNAVLGQRFSFLLLIHKELKGG